jgi:hypothetical protein
MMKYDHVGGSIDDDEYDVYGDGDGGGEDDTGMITKIVMIHRL